MLNESTSSFDGTIVRFIVRNNHILFAANDVAKALKFSNPRRAVINVILTENDYISVTGNWSNGDLIFMADETCIIDLISTAEKEIAKRFISWLLITLAHFRDNKLESSNDGPDPTGRNEPTFSTTQIAKKYNLSAKRLNEILHLEGIHYKTNNQWVLYSKYSGLGLTKTFMITLGEDNQKKVYHSYWTEDGVKFIENVLSKIGASKSSQDTLF